MSLINVGKRFYRCLVWGNVLMGLSAAGWVVVTWEHLMLPPDPILALLAFALAIVFYTRDRLDPQEQATDSLTFPERTQWVQQHQTRLKVWIGSALIVALGCIVLRPLTLAPLMTGVGFALTYTMRWIPWRGQRWASKQVPALKMPYVALLWTILTIFTPVTVYGAWENGRLWHVAGALFLLIMTQILINDLRDMEGDRHGKTYSLPILVGDYWARLWGIVLVGVACVVGFLLYHPALPITALYTGILLMGYRRAQDNFWRPFIEAQGVVAGVLSLLY